MRLEAYTHSAFDDRPRALQAFRALLALDPQFRPPAKISPKILQYFEEARQKPPLPSQDPLAAPLPSAAVAPSPGVAIAASPPAPRGGNRRGCGAGSRLW